ncbi:MAG: phosphotransferase [Bifidobacteriaceae bacterium]|jgi:thiamine kinase-like enzyme|nr:phosphotransferase [Bifidobacteriaceae bacterium]
MNDSSGDQPASFERAARAAVAELMAVPANQVEDMRPLTEGMTNTSFTFSLRGESQRYVVRLPGPGTEELIDRSAERDAYRAIAPFDLADEVVALDKHGRRITVFYEDARVANPDDDADLAISMGLIRQLHALNLPLERRFDIDGMITQYEGLCAATRQPPYPKLKKTRRRVAELQAFKRQLDIAEIFCHGDMAAINVLLLGDGSAKLIDYEYSGQADPIMDVAMYSIIAYYKRERMELALRLYLEREPTALELARLYLYAALAGYLWSLWAHYKGESGQDFGSYGLDMYNYARRYYRRLMRSELAEAALNERAAELGRQAPKRRQAPTDTASPATERSATALAAAGATAQGTGQ